MVPALGPSSEVSWKPLKLTHLHLWLEKGPGQTTFKNLYQYTKAGSSCGDPGKVPQTEVG